MKFILSFFLCLLYLVAQAATPFTEFYCNSTGTNINAGSTTNAAATFSDANGNWDAATGIFICSGPSDLSGVAAGDWASVFVDGATTAVFIGRILTVVDATDTITVSLTIKTGTAPSTAATARSIKVGGAWFGPWYSGATVDNLPFNFVNNLLTNTSQHSTKVYLKNDRIYATTNVVHSSNGPIMFEGYSDIPGDGGKTWITGSTVGASSTLFTLSGNNCVLSGFVLATNGASGNSTLVIMSGGENVIYKSSVFYSRGTGLLLNNANLVIATEVAFCNLNNSSDFYGLGLASTGAGAIGCVAHDNSGTGTSGFGLASGLVWMTDCISESNGRNGILVSSSAGAIIKNCSIYNNSTNGINFTSTSALLGVVENCAFFQNGVGKSDAYAINSSGSLLRNGMVINCAFGTGTATNGSGGANILPGTGLYEIGSIGLAADVLPWVDAANGNFTLTNTSSLINAGRGTFTQTAPGYGGTVSYPDIGAAQITNSAAGTTTVISYPIFRR